MSTISDMTTATLELSTPERIRKFAQAKPEGEPFTVRELAGVGQRAAVDQALSRMVKAGELERPARGVYARPKVNRTLGRRVPTSPEKVVTAIAAADGEQLAPHGAEAARRLGLTTQTPLNTVYVTSGRSRKIRVGMREVQLRHASPRSLALAGEPAGVALAALRYLGKSEVTTATVKRVAEAIGSVAFARLRENVSAMPAWLADVVLKAAM